MTPRFLTACALAALTTLAALPAGAEGNEFMAYECRFDRKEAERAFLPEVLVVAYWTWDDRAVISDPLIEASKGAPLEVKMENATGPRVRFSWRLKVRPPGLGQRDYDFRLSIVKNGLWAQIKSSGTEQYSMQTHFADGKCRRVKA